MELQDYIDDIKLELTAGILELEIPDEIIGKIVNKALREIQRYIDTTKIITVPFAPVIDMTGFECSAITNIYRTSSVGSDGDKSSFVDPMYLQSWLVSTGTTGPMYNLNRYLMNYMSYQTLLQIRNTTSTDLNFKYDKQANKLYINVAFGQPEMITIEYVPIFKDVSDVTSDYWIDILKRLSLAMTKVALGRARTRFTQSGALWTQDGETILAEGNEELTQLREVLRTNSNLFYPLD